VIAGDIYHQEQSRDCWGLLETVGDGRMASMTHFSRGNRGAPVVCREWQGEFGKDRTGRQNVVRPSSGLGGMNCSVENSRSC